MADFPGHDQPLVSVMMPVYNGEKTIMFAIKSLLMQTYKNWLCIIVNDGSTDGTRLILDRLTDNRFKIIHLSENIGRGAARQIALDNAEGNYLAYLDADDFYHEDKLERQVEILNRYSNIALIGGRLMSFDSNYKPISLRGSLLTQPILYKMGASLKLCMATAMIRLPEAKSFKYNSKLNAAEDADYFSRYLNGKQYQNIPDVLLYYSVTESTTYSKILHYTSLEILRGFLMFGEYKKAALKTIILCGTKWLIYACFIPLLGTKFFISRRGISVSDKENNLFIQQKIKLDNIRF